jgi:hypothetical protein
MPLPFSGSACFLFGLFSDLKMEATRSSETSEFHWTTGPYIQRTELFAAHLRVFELFLPSDTKSKMNKTIKMSEEGKKDEKYKIPMKKNMTQEKGRKERKCITLKCR